MKDRLYIEYRVYFDLSSNQEMIAEMAEAAVPEIQKMFSHDETVPQCMDVTKHVVRTYTPPK